jgi:hypothetical protein
MRSHGEGLWEMIVFRFSLVDIAMVEERFEGVLTIREYKLG